MTVRPASSAFFKIIHCFDERCMFLQDDFMDARGEPLDICPKQMPEFLTVKATRTGLLTDKISSIGGPWLLLNERGKEAASSLRVCPSITWIRTQLSIRSKPLPDRYYLALPRLYHPIWDYERSECSWIPGRKKGIMDAVGFMTHGVANRELLPDLDLFIAEELLWIASSRFRNRMASENLTGFLFEKIDVE